MAASSFGSNNPFRRTTSYAAPTTVASQPASSHDTEYYQSDGIDHPSPRPTGDEFRSQLQALASSAQPAPKTSFLKPKVVKRVRVQSPPPSSPESAGAPDVFPPVSRYAGDSSSDLGDALENPFGMAGSVSYQPEAMQQQQRQQQQLRQQSSPMVGQGPPANPFQRTLSDMEASAVSEAQAAVSAAPSRGALDVDAFHRLLMTGQPGDTIQASSPVPAVPAVPTAGFVSTGDGGSTTDTSSARQSLFEASHSQDSPQTSHEISEPEVNGNRSESSGRTVATRKPDSGSSAVPRKKPPPPSSRHGKLIKLDFGAGEAEEEIPRPLSSHSMSSARSSQSGPSDLNKPLPLPPDRSDEVESVFDREAAGKVPEHASIYAEPVDLPRPPTPPKSSRASVSPSAIPQASKKPAPPPRRQPHGRSESKSVAMSVIPAALSTVDDKEMAPRRASHESNRSRSSSLRVNIHGPAPPPPRRANAASRSPGSFNSTPPAAMASGALPDADQGSFSESPFGQASPLADVPGSQTVSPNPSQAVSSAGTASHAAHTGPHKLAPPPPPPARSASVRSNKAPSLSSFDGVSRRIPRSGEHATSGAPPPPPPRQRGSSKSSMEAPPLGQRRTSVDSVRVRTGGLPEPSEVGVVQEEEENLATSAAERPAEAASSEAYNILADLDALQREVDALRQQQ